MIIGTHLGERLPSESPKDGFRATNYELICGANVRLRVPAAADEQSLWCPRHQKWEELSAKGKDRLRSSPARVHPRQQRNRNKLNMAQIKEMKKLYEAGTTKVALAAQFDVHRSTVYDVLHDQYNYKGE